MGPNKKPRLLESFNCSRLEIQAKNLFMVHNESILDRDICLWCSVSSSRGLCGFTWCHYIEWEEKERIRNTAWQVHGHWRDALLLWWHTADISLLKLCFTHKKSHNTAGKFNIRGLGRSIFTTLNSDLIISIYIQVINTYSVCWFQRGPAELLTQSGLSHRDWNLNLGAGQVNPFKLNGLF